MDDRNVKYSIIIPVKNGSHYLQACVESIITQDYRDYEVIISDDDSTDEGGQYLQELRHPCTRIVHPPKGFSMTEHWEWALSQARGTWLIYVGQDDGLQPYFFTLADQLTAKAEPAGLRAIMSRRAYFFWPGCKDKYGDVAVDYRAVAAVRVRNSFYEAMLALLGFQQYFELPEMYTSALFHHSLIEEAKHLQNGHLLVTHPQDANLAAIAVSLDQKYLRSEIPLGWIGSSPRSAGMAISGTSQTNDVQKQLKRDYLGSIATSQLRYHPQLGDFSLGSISLYFWGALLQTTVLRPKWQNAFIKSSIFRVFLLGAVRLELLKSKRTGWQSHFADVRALNHCHPLAVWLASGLLQVLHPLHHLARQARNWCARSRTSHCEFYATWTGDPGMNLSKASHNVSNLCRQKHLLECSDV